MEGAALSGWDAVKLQNMFMSLIQKRITMKRYQRVAKPNRKARIPLSEERVAEALRKSGGIITDAAKLCGRSQPRLSQMIGESDYLKEVRKQESKQLVELAKSSIREFLESGKLTYNRLLASMFTLKTLAKNEGWSERLETIGVHAHLNAGKRGVLLLPQPSESLGSWKRLAEQWENERKCIDYRGDDVVDIDDDDY